MAETFTTVIQASDIVVFSFAEDILKSGDLTITWSLEFELKEYGIKSTLISIKNIEGDLKYKTKAQQDIDLDNDLDEDDNLSDVPVSYDWFGDILSFTLGEKQYKLKVEHDFSFTEYKSLFPNSVQINVADKVEIN